MTQPKTKHTTVLLQPAVDYLNVLPDQWYLDATLGGGGHTLEILNSGGKVIAIDQDIQAIDRTRHLIETACPDAEFHLVHNSFENINQILNTHSNPPITGILFDLGISSDQLDTPERGFSFRTNSPLDMRMDQTKGKTAAELLDQLTEKQLVNLLRDLADEPRATRIAAEIIRHKPITTTAQLADLITKVIPNNNKGIHPATKTFQALRIAVNRELDQLISALPQAWNALSPSGHLVVISFHSGEDRIVKHFFAYHQQQGSGELLTPKPVLPSESEINTNPRARSAKLRAIKKY